MILLACIKNEKRKVIARYRNVNSLNDACFNSPISDPLRPVTGSESPNRAHMNQNNIINVEII